jgi:uncharacterized protein (DUF427 family)
MTTRVLETSHPPVFYVPPEDVAMELLSPSGRQTVCEFKGSATYWDLVDERPIRNVAWSYPRPTTGFADIRDWIAFYPSKVECFVGGERVEPQDGGFYGGWITPEITGPFKGAAGTWGW